MPLSSRLVLRNSYCSAPPLTSSLRPPRLSRAEEARRPLAPLREVKAEVFESEESVEFIVDEEDLERPVKLEQPVKCERPFIIEPDPRQITARIAAIAIGQPTSAASTSLEENPGPSGTAYRTQALRRVPSSQLGPADRPRGRGGPKGSKSRSRIPIVFGLSTPPERAATAKARAEMAEIGLRGALRQSHSGRPPVPKRRSK